MPQIYEVLRVFNYPINNGNTSYVKIIYYITGTEVEIQLPLKRSSRFQRLCPNPSWLVWGRASRYQKLAPTFSGIDSCLMVTKRDFLEMEASLWLNWKSQNVAKGWLSTLCCWEAAVHTLDLSWKKMDVKLMMMMMTIEYVFSWLMNK